MVNPVASSQAYSQAPSSAPIFVWFFGYVGSVFYPQKNLSITPQQMISAAASMSLALRSTTRLRFVSAVNQVQLQTINWKNSTLVAQIRNYVGNLSRFGQAYGRIDLEQFNYTSKTTVYKEVSLFNDSLGLGGLWLDHAAVLYGNTNSSQSKFNSMMQNLTIAFPKLVFILNQSQRTKTGGKIITPNPGTTWNETTYISPSVRLNTYNGTPGPNALEEFNTYYKGHVLLHFDSFAQKKNEPMGIFAEQNATIEEQAIKTLASEGVRWANQSKPYGFSLLFPILGAWTYNGALGGGTNYHGTLYNSLSVGTYARFTLANFTGTMSMYP